MKFKLPDIECFCGRAPPADLSTRISQEGFFVSKTNEVIYRPVCPGGCKRGPGLCSICHIQLTRQRACVWQTTREIAKLLGVPVELLIEHNAAKYPGITASSKLKRDTWYNLFFLFTCPSRLSDVNYNMSHTQEILTLYAAW